MKCKFFVAFLNAQFLTLIFLPRERRPRPRVNGRVTSALFNLKVSIRRYARARVQTESGLVSIRGGWKPVPACIAIINIHNRDFLQC